MESEPVVLHKWAAQLENYNFEVSHHSRENQGHVDTFSRSLICLIGDEIQQRATQEGTMKLFVAFATVAIWTLMVL